MKVTLEKGEQRKKVKGGKGGNGKKGRGRKEGREGGKEEHPWTKLVP